jgi:hypothetical protein
MAAESTFRGTIDFLASIGIFDVVLPFLLVFTIMFALLEKTRVFGTEKVGETEYTKKHLNSLASFVIAFFVIASSRLVEIITEISSQVVVLLLAGVFFLLLAGTFHQQKPEGYFLEGRFKDVFMIIMFVGLVFIFLNAIETGDKSWLEWVLAWLRDFGDNVSVASVVLILSVVGVMWWVTQAGSADAPKHGNGSGK